MIGDGDVAAIMSNGDFNEDVVFGGTLTVQGWFTSESDATTPYPGVDIEAQKPSVICDTDDVTTVRNGMTALIRSITYTVVRIEKLGIGNSVVYLKT